MTQLKNQAWIHKSSSSGILIAYRLHLNVMTLKLPKFGLFLLLFLLVPFQIAHAGILEQVEKELVSLADKVRPAVVSLSPYIAKGAVGQGLPRKSRPANAGSGVIFDGEKGLIVTNSHVVRNVLKIQVTFKDGRKVVGEVLGSDEDTDLAVVKIPIDEPLTAVKFADSSKVKIGQLVVAVGNPYGLNDTTTFGIVSGLKRENVNLSRYEDFIQTDASINPGNSGGPLLNIKGEVIGINTAIINYAQSIGFSIPSNMVLYIVDQLVKHGEVSRGWLGVGIDPISEEVAEEINIKEGVVINSVFEGDPAHQAGLKVGDVILRIGGAKIDSPNSLIRIIGTITPGQTINLDIVRNGEHKVIPVKLESKKKKTSLLASIAPGDPTSLGFSVADSDPNKDGERGAKVTDVKKGSYAESKGLLVDDRILAINGEMVENQREFKDILGRIKKGDSIFLLVFRNNKKIHLGLVRQN
ncbi:MAG: PDZ domain-containing protein [Nitrospinae bacterium]|nr:PDZ domain-containing protein [Nitrospinota bacterium]MZH05114.1 PDZ domain-containing protein [Nitrospinota bacterium]